jgi:hypothetical protein
VSSRDAGYFLEEKQELKVNLSKAGSFALSTLGSF